MKRDGAMASARKTLCIALALCAGCDDGNGEHYELRSMPAATQSAHTATEWFALELQLVRDTPGFTPPVASRAFAYAGITLYEAVVHGMPDYVSLAGELGLTLPAPVAGEVYYWPAVANSAMATITRQLFATAKPAGVAAIDALEAKLDVGYSTEVGHRVLERSAAYGRDLAAAIFEWSRSDGADQAYLHNFPLDYVPPAGPGLWVPTPPAYLRAMQPYWGANRLFALTNVDDCDGMAPPAYSTDPGSCFYEEAQEVYATSKRLTPEQIEIARFWSDDPGQTATPTGHSISITTQVLEQNGATLELAAETYAKVGMAVADAIITCWATKFEFNVLRPVSYVQAQLDPQWMPLLVTPPFPEYSSGHSAQSGAAAQVLTDLFGVMTFTDHTHDARGFAPRTFASFEAAAQEAAISRLYGGIHYRSAIEDGLVMGQCVGATVSAMRFRR